VSGEPGRRPRLAADPLAELAQLPGVPSAVAAAMAAVDVVLRDRGLRAIPEAVRDSALRLSAEASAALTDDHDRWALGALRLAMELPRLATVIRVAPAQALARAHVLAALGESPQEELGRLGGDPSAGERMRAVGALLASPTTAPAVVLGAVVHAEIAVVAPFGAASGLVARAAEHLVLISAGVDPLGVIVVEAGHREASGYPAGLTAYAEGTMRSVGAWIIRCAEAVSRGAERSPVI
jgi:hypothetical protein